VRQHVENPSATAALATPGFFEKTFDDVDQGDRLLDKALSTYRRAIFSVL
jgi:hypothetical protein